MESQLERALPVVAVWGGWILGALLLATLLGVWGLGRGRRFLVPAGWPGRLLSAALCGLALLWAGGLFAMLGPLRPTLSQVRGIHGTVNRPAQELAFREVGTDSPRRLSELRGKVVVLNLWATWCEPCRRELPEIDRLQKAYAERGLVVVTLSTEERDHLLAFAARYPVSTLNVYAREIGWLDVGGRPLSLVIDRDGTVRECLIGARSYAEFESAIAKYVVARS